MSLRIATFRDHRDDAPARLARVRAEARARQDDHRPWALVSIARERRGAKWVELTLVTGDVAFELREDLGAAIDPGFGSQHRGYDFWVEAVGSAIEPDDVIRGG